MSTKLSNLLGGAVADDALSQGSSNILMGTTNPQVVLHGAAGADPTTLTAASVTLLHIIVDESSSMVPHIKAVVDGYNALRDALISSKQAPEFLVSLWTFNTTAKSIHSYVELKDSEPLTSKNYSPDGTTALYDTWLDACAAMVAYSQQLLGSGTPCKSVAVILTDGEDVGSRRGSGECKTVTEDLLKREIFTPAFVGVGRAADFHRIARSMGIPDSNILEAAKATAHDIRNVFHVVSQSAIRASQTQVSPGSNTGFFT